MSPTYELIDSITLSSNQSSVSFNNIPQTYDDLLILSSARTNRASDSDPIKLRFNGSSSDANHTSRILQGSGSSVTSGSESWLNAGMAAGNSSTSNTYGNVQTYIPNYNSSSNKSVSGYGTSENNSTTSYISRTAGLWSSTSTISQIQILPIYGTLLLTNSTFELYGIKNADDGSEGYFGPAARGGDEVYTTGDGYKVHVFKTSGTLEVTSPGEVECLVVAGGGGAGGSYYSGGGGGGAGGVLTSNRLITPNTYSIIVGAGGTGGTGSVNGVSGTQSSFTALNSIGGGGGGGTDGGAGLTGGSGGGGQGGGIATSSGGLGTSGQGNNGGGGVGSTLHPGPIAGGGGGGAGAAGANAVVYATNEANGGNGGNGILWAGNYYGGGGGGGKRLSSNGVPGTGGLGGGGNGVGGGTPNSGNGYAGTINTGGAGGGAGISDGSTRTGGTGGSGIVIIRYKV